MSPLEWFNFIREILTWDTERQAAFFTGCGITLGIGLVVLFLFFRFFRRRSREKNLLKVVDLTREKGELQNRVTRLESDVQLLKLELATKEENIGKALQTAFFQKSQFQALTATLNDLTNRNRLLEDENQHLKAKNAERLRGGRQLLQQRAELRAQVAKLSENCEDLEAKIADTHSSRQELNERLQAIQQQINDVAQLEGKLWERPVTDPVAAFRPLAERKVPIVAVANLKGGVGKTTLTANLGAALWHEGKRVLLVDLDYQGSLTALCLSERTIADLKSSDRLVHKVFQNGSDGPDINSCLARIGDSSGSLLPATDKLADVEMDAMTRWLLEPQCPDIRFNLRRWLHGEAITDNFDVIIIDCPPRLTTASINALTCCDYILIPVLLDGTSADAVPRFLKWLKILKATPLCAQMAILGVLANRAHFYKDDLVGREQRLWQDLPDKCQDVWGEKVYHFRTIVKEDSQIAEAATAHTLAARSSKLEAVFLDLVREVRRRLNLHESNRVAVLR